MGRAIRESTELRLGADNPRVILLFMKTPSLCLSLFLITMTVNAQPTWEDVMTRLNSDLMALKSLPALPNGIVLPNLFAMSTEDRAALRKTVANRSPDQDQVMMRYADAMAKFYEKTVVPWDLAYALTSVLAGKDLSNDALTPLTGAILHAVYSAFVCINTGSHLGNSAHLRPAVEHAYHALLPLHPPPPTPRTPTPL